MSMTDALENDTWNLSHEKFETLKRIGLLFKKLGFSVWCVEITTWRKGYDFEVYDVSKVKFNNKAYYRFYIDTF